MSADQPDDPSANDRPPTVEQCLRTGARPNAADGEIPPTAGTATAVDRQVPVTAVDDGRSTSARSSKPSISVQQAALQETRIAVLQSRVAALEDALDAERDRRRAVVDRYERILEERDDSGRGTGDDSSLRERLRQFLSF